jgi:hypothetical protein
MFACILQLNEKKVSRISSCPKDEVDSCFLVGKNQHGKKVFLLTRQKEVELEFPLVHISNTDLS